MPLYDYDCSACGTRFEVMHGVHADGPAACPSCGSDRVRKAFAAPAVHFKGSGWAKKERRATATPGASKATGDGPGSDGSSSGGHDSSGASEAGAPPDATSGSKDGKASKDGKGASTPAAPASAGSGASAD